MKNTINIKNACNWYFALWCLYRLQGTLYPSESLISQFLLLVILLMSLRHFVFFLKDFKTMDYIKGLVLLILMFIIYGLLLIITDGAITKSIRKVVPTYFYLKQYLVSLLPILTCYYYAKKKYLNTKLLTSWVPIFLFVAICEFFRYQREAHIGFVGERLDITNNAGYIFLGLIPCMCVLKNRTIQYFGVAICVMFVFFAMKRGAIIISSVIVLIYLYYEFKKNHSYRKIQFVFLFFIISAVSVYYLQHTLFLNDYFNTRVEKTLEGDTSNRENLYEECVDFYLNEASIFQQIFGLGADGTLKVTYDYAHNDWLEILIDQGILGIFIFFNYWWCFYRAIFKGRLSQSSKRILIIIFVFTLLRTFFSMSIGDHTIYVASVLGLALADRPENKGISIEMLKIKGRIKKGH